MDLEWLLSIGYFGLFLGTFLAATIIPFSSDVLFIGMLVAGGDVWRCVLVATAGNWLGGITSYWIGYVGKWEWIERVFRIKEATLIKQKAYLDKYGSLMALFTWLPFVGEVIAIALGFYRVNFSQSALYMLIGKGARFALWATIYLCF